MILLCYSKLNVISRHGFSVIVKGANSFSYFKYTSFHLNFNKFWNDESTDINTIKEWINSCEEFHLLSSKLNVSRPYKRNYLTAKNLISERLIIKLFLKGSSCSSSSLSSSSGGCLKGFFNNLIVSSNFSCRFGLGLTSPNSFPRSPCYGTKTSLLIKPFLRQLVKSLGIVSFRLNSLRCNSYLIYPNVR